MEGLAASVCRARVGVVVTRVEGIVVTWEGVIYHRKRHFANRNTKNGQKNEVTVVIYIGPDRLIIFNNRLNCMQWF